LTMSLLKIFYNGDYNTKISRVGLIGLFCLLVAPRVKFGVSGRAQMGRVTLREHTWWPIYHHIEKFCVSRIHKITLKAFSNDIKKKKTLITNHENMNQKPFFLQTTAAILLFFCELRVELDTDDSGNSSGFSGNSSGFSGNLFRFSSGVS